MKKRNIVVFGMLALVSVALIYNNCGKPGTPAANIPTATATVSCSKVPTCASTCNQEYPPCGPGVTGGSCDQIQVLLQLCLNAPTP